MRIVLKDLGLIDYAKAWEIQEDIFAKTIEQKKENNQTIGTFIFCEHPHVFTLGKSGDEQNFLINKDFLKQIKATYFKTNRGGDITYHGPGQIIGYPIIDLEKVKVSLKDYIYKLEEVIIKTIATYHVKGEHNKQATGVWIDNDLPQKARKICAIGVKASKFITMHGLALNVNTNLNYFDYINPCGFTDKGVTSLQKELQKTVEIEEVKTLILEKFQEIFNVEVV